nr:MAG TPA: hypothetical protein [Caudoviricetes sp.]
MPGEIIVTQTKINAVPGDSTINPYRHTQNHREDNSMVSKRR